MEEGLTSVAEALGVVQRNGEYNYEGELNRLKGELLLQCSVETPKAEVLEEAEACFQESLATTRRRGAKSLELRPDTSLSRLWQQQGKKEEAQRLLAEVYDWFTEGFDTEDLRRAKALLDRLL
jgi:predicted ATPase